MRGLRQWVAAALAALALMPAQAETSLTYEQVLQRVFAVDASLRIAEMERERARHERARVDSRLGWVAGAETSVARDMSAFGTPVDRVDASASLDRPFASGSVLGIRAGVVREEVDSKENDTALFPAPVNPSHSTRIDLSYRMPLAHGSGNPDYRLGLIGAETGEEVADAGRDAGRDALARVVADLYFGAAFTRARMRAAEEAIARAERFKAYIGNNVRLGVAEEKDRLQAEAQLRARFADRQALAVSWENQRTALNRLMRQPWNEEWQPRLDDSRPTDIALAALEEETLARSAELRRERARLRLAEVALERARDQGRDKFDLVLSAGNRRFDGELAPPQNGTVAESGNVAGVRVEYRAALARGGADAEVAQAYLDRSMASERVAALEIELRYTVARLASEIRAAGAALEQARAHKEAERAKLEEASRRHRQGRTDTAQIIQFENDYEMATLTLEQQAIELARRTIELDLVRGALLDTSTNRDAVLPKEQP